MDSLFYRCNSVQRLTQHLIYYIDTINRCWPHDTGLNPQYRRCDRELKSVTIENYRAIENLELSLDPWLTVLHGANGHGKTSVLSAIAVGLVGAVNFLGPDLHKSNIDFSEEDWREGAASPRIAVESTDGTIREREGDRAIDEQKEAQRIAGNNAYRLGLDEVLATREREKDMQIVAFYGTERTVSGVPEWVISQPGSRFRPSRLDALEGALAARTDFEGFLAWFYFKRYEELQERRTGRIPIIS